MGKQKYGYSCLALRLQMDTSCEILASIYLTMKNYP